MSGGEEDGANGWMFGGSSGAGNGGGMSEMVVRFEINVIKVSRVSSFLLSRSSGSFRFRF